jgi:hypothetical protein
VSHLEMVSSWVMDFSMNLEKSSALKKSFRSHRRFTWRSATCLPN